MIHGNSRDLIGVVGLTILALVVMQLRTDTAVGLSLLALPLGLFLPGYALAAALFPRGSLRFPEMLAFSLGLSLAADIVGGVILNLISDEGLTTLPWTIFLVTVTLGACAIAARSRRHRLEPAAVSSSLGMSIGQVSLLAVSIIVVAGAIMIVRDPSVQPSANFTELWARRAALLGQTAFDIGVYNSESKNMEYRLEVKAEGDSVYDAFMFDLAPRETWKKVLTFQTEVRGDVQMLLYRMDDPGKTYRQVVARSGTH